MNNEKEKDLRNSRNKFELEGNVANISDIYVGQNNKKILRFDLAQNNNGTTQYVPIVIKGELVNSYGNKIKKGDWVTIKGRISTYTKDIINNDKTYKEKSIDILGFEITDRKNNKIYTSDGQVHDKTNQKFVMNEIER